MRTVPQEHAAARAAFPPDPTGRRKNMSLIKREPSPAQSEASRANSLLSTGPRTAHGKAISSLNGFATRRHCVRETLKTDIKNEAASLLKTKDPNFESSRGEADTLLKQRRLHRDDMDTKSW
jgi:hypothetical protein